MKLRGRANCPKHFIGFQRPSDEHFGAIKLMWGNISQSASSVGTSDLTLDTAHIRPSNVTSVNCVFILLSFWHFSITSQVSNNIKCNYLYNLRWLSWGHQFPPLSKWDVTYPGGWVCDGCITAVWGDVAMCHAIVTISVTTPHPRDSSWQHHVGTDSKHNK